MPFVRSAATCGTGDTSVFGPDVRVRQQLNQVSLMYLLPTHLLTSCYSVSSYYSVSSGYSVSSPPPHRWRPILTVAQCTVVLTKRWRLSETGTPVTFCLNSHLSSYHCSSYSCGKHYRHYFDGNITGRLVRVSWGLVKSSVLVRTSCLEKMTWYLRSWRVRGGEYHHPEWVYCLLPSHASLADSSLQPLPSITYYTV